MIVPRLKSLAEAVKAAEIEDMEISSIFLKRHCGVADLEIVEKLEMQVDSEIQTISVIGEFLKNLKILKLENSRLPCLRDLGGKLQQLKILKLARSEISDISGLSGLPALEELYVPFNSISRLQPLVGSADFLAVADFEGNCISEESQLQCFQFCPKLQQLNLAGNAVSSKLSRKQIISWLPEISTLDDLSVKAEGLEERDDLEILENLRKRKEIQPSTSRSSVSTARPKSSASELTCSPAPFQGNPLEAIRFRKKLNN